MSGDATAPLIAIVDDDATVRVAMDGLVRSAGYRSVMFGCGAAFLASYRKHEVDCLVLDIEMPGMERPIYAAAFSGDEFLVPHHHCHRMRRRALTNGTEARRLCSAAEDL
jgi:DNA-binding NtrC family response regulator